MKKIFLWHPILCHRKLICHFRPTASKIYALFEPLSLFVWLLYEWIRKNEDESGEREVWKRVTVTSRHVRFLTNKPTKTPLAPFSCNKECIEAQLASHSFNQRFSLCHKIYCNLKHIYNLFQQTVEFRHKSLQYYGCISQLKLVLLMGVKRMSLQIISTPKLILLSLVKGSLLFFISSFIGRCFCGRT
jgi:hypothetical protein